MMLRAKAGASARTRTMACSRCCSRTPSAVCKFCNRDRWLDVPPLADSLVCNAGDMLERLTNGRYLSALHRAKNLTVRERLSMVLFLDPAFDAKLEPLPGVVPGFGQPHTNVRWDRIDPHALQGTYGEYLLSKVSKVFPELAPAVR